MEEIKVVTLSVEQVLPVRHAVLWPHKPQIFCQLKEDQQGEHFGVELEGQVVCVASVFTNSREVRLRKFATLENFQGRGIGSTVLQYLIGHYQEKGFQYFWFDARETAIAFYQQFGFAKQGSRFYKSDIAYFKMAKIL